MAYLESIKQTLVLNIHISNTFTYIVLEAGRDKGVDLKEVRRLLLSFGWLHGSGWDNHSSAGDGTMAPRQRETPGLDGGSSEADWAVDPWLQTAGQIL